MAVNAVPSIVLALNLGAPEELVEAFLRGCEEEGVPVITHIEDGAAERYWCLNPRCGQLRPLPGGPITAPAPGRAPAEAPTAARPHVG